MINIKNEIKKIIGKDVLVEMPKKDNMGDFSVPCFHLTNEDIKNRSEDRRVGKEC